MLWKGVQGCVTAVQNDNAEKDEGKASGIPVMEKFHLEREKIPKSHVFMGGF